MSALESKSRTRLHRRLSTGVSVSALGLTALVGCGDLSEFIEPITPAKLAGEWQTTDLVLTNADDPTQTLDVIDAGGSLTLRFSLDGEFQWIVQAPGQADDVELGTWEIVDDFILVEPTDAPQDTIHLQYEFQETRTTFTLTLLSDDFDYDFDGNGTEEPALMFAIANR